MYRNNISHFAEVVLNIQTHFSFCRSCPIHRYNSNFPFFENFVNKKFGISKNCFSKMCLFSRADFNDTLHAYIQKKNIYIGVNSHLDFQVAKLAQMARRSAVNWKVASSKIADGEFFFFFLF